MDAIEQSTAVKPKRSTIGQDPDARMPWVLPVALVWHVVVMLACLYAAYSIISLTDFLNLGRPVQVFVAAVCTIPAIVALVSSVLMLRRHRSGRFIGMMLNFVGMVLSIAVLLEFWGFYKSFSGFVDVIMANALVTLGFALGYALFWLGGRFSERGRIGPLLERVGMAVAGLTLVALLLLTDVVRTASNILARYQNAEVWLATIAAVMFGVVAWRLLMSSRYFGETPEGRVAWQGWLLLSPNIIGFMIFFAGPLLLSLYLSFTDASFGQVPQVNGLANYGKLFSLEIKTVESLTVPAQSALSFGFAVLGEMPWGDGRLIVGARDVTFWISLRNTILYCLMLIPLAILPALVLSLILNSKLPGMKFFRAVYFLPSVAAVVGTALIWRWLYDPNIGYTNYILSPIIDSLNETFGLGITPPLWLSDPNIVLLSVVLLAAWGLIGYNTVLFLAGLQGIPGVLYEAARIDGANRWQQFTNVTLPMLGPTTFFVTITTVVTGLQVFNEPYALFPSPPIPLNATTSVYYIYTQGFQQTQFGYASAIAWVLFALIFGITLLQFRFNRNNAYE